MWDGEALTRIDFDEAHVKRRQDGNHQRILYKTNDGRHTVGI
jgi:hypothetical protein